MAGCIVTDVAFHPFYLSKTLMQLGFEPMPAKPSKTLFGKPVMRLPSVFSYIGYIRRNDGFFGMYRGVSAKILMSISKGFVFANTQFYLQENWLKPRNWRRHMSKRTLKTAPAYYEYDEDESIREAIPPFMDHLIVETCSRTLAIIISHPFHVITVRMCAEFVGHESNYTSIVDMIRDLFKPGIFSGLAPRLIADLVLFWACSSITFLVCKSVNPRVGKMSVVKNYVTFAANFIFTAYLYPFHIVSTVMAVTDVPGDELMASRLDPPFENWLQCWRYLSLSGELSRGASPIWRYQNDVTRRMALKKAY